MNKLRNTIYYEFFTVDDMTTPKKMGTRVLGATNITTGIDTVPTMTITIPLEDFPTDELANVAEGMYFEPRMQRYVVVVHVQTSANNRDLYNDKYTFRGVIDSMVIDYANFAVQLNLSHQVARMREWAMPINYTVKDMPIDFLISEKAAALGYANPPTADGNIFSMQSYDQQIYFEFRDFVTIPTVQMTFSANNKLEALSNIMNNTEYCHFWVDLSKSQPTIVIQNYEQPLDQAATAGELIVSPYPVDEDDCDDIPSENYITLLTEPSFNVDYTSHYNRAVVFCGDIQDGVNHLTLQHIYENPSLQDPNFPVKMYSYELEQQPDTEYDTDGKKINNEKIYQPYEVIAYTTNGNREYFVEDTQQLADDSYIALNTTFNFSDLYPIPSLKQDKDNDGVMEELVITDDDRTAIEYQAYLRAVRKLKAQRPQRVYQFNATAFPVGTYDGQPVRLAYSKTVNQYDSECDNDFTKRKVLNINQLFYLTKRTISFDDTMNEITTVTLDGVLRSRDISAREIELFEAATTPTQTRASHPDLGSYTNKEDPWRTTYANNINGVTVKAPGTGVNPSTLVP